MSRWRAHDIRNLIKWMVATQESAQRPRKQCDESFSQHWWGQVAPILKDLTLCCLAGGYVDVHVLTSETVFHVTLWPASPSACCFIYSCIWVQQPEKESAASLVRDDSRRLEAVIYYFFGLMTVVFFCLSVASLWFKSGHDRFWHLSVILMSVKRKTEGEKRVLEEARIQTLALRFWKYVFI